MSLLGKLDRVLTSEGKLEGSNLPFPSPLRGPPITLKLAVVASGHLSSLGTRSYKLD